MWLLKARKLGKTALVHVEVLNTLPFNKQRRGTAPTAPREEEQEEEGRRERLEGWIHRLTLCMSRSEECWLGRGVYQHLPTVQQDQLCLPEIPPL